MQLILCSPFWKLPREQYIGQLRLSVRHSIVERPFIVVKVFKGKVGGEGVCQRTKKVVVFVTQLVERTLLTSQIRESNTVIGNLFTYYPSTVL